MSPGTPSRFLSSLVVGLLLAAGVVYGLGWLLGPTRGLRNQALLGQPIVQAIEKFRRQTGIYPAELTDLVPKYLPAIPDPDGNRQRQSFGWEYRTIEIDASVSYRLRYWIDEYGVEYEPPTWFGTADGRRSVLFSNE